MPPGRKEGEAAGQGGFSDTIPHEGEASLTLITDPDELEAARLAYESDERDTLERLAAAMERWDNDPDADPLWELY